MQLPNVVLANTIPTVYLKQNYQNYSELIPLNFVFFNMTACDKILQNSKLNYF